MTSVQAFRDFINQRLNAAAGEIFTEFEQTIVRYEEEIDRQRRLLEICWKQTDLHQHYDCWEEQLIQQESDQEEPESPQVNEEPEEPEPPQVKEEPGEPEPPQIKEEPEEPEPPQIEDLEELGTSQEGEQLTLTLGSETLRVPSTEEQSYLSEPEEVPDPEQLLCHDCEVQDVNKQTDSQSTTNAELKKTNKIHVDDFPESENQAECEVVLSEETCEEMLPKKRKIRQTSRPGKKNRTCEICGKFFNQPYLLLSHMRIHTGEKPYPCETCGKRFTDRSNLSCHMRTHTGERPYSCGTCGKSFGQRSTLLCHIRTHTGEKPYSCETCGKRFTAQSDLMRHMRSHTLEKPYSCETCGKGFRQKSYFLAHVRTHTGEKPESCETLHCAE